MVRFNTVLILAMAWVVVVSPAAADSVGMTGRRVRSSTPAIAALIAEAGSRSPAFRGIVNTINDSDGIVYVEEGECGHSVRACLVLKVTIAGPNRILRIMVDTRKQDWDLMGSIAHELRHAVEVLSDPANTSDGAVFFFYHRDGMTAKGVFETDAAIAAGDAVRSEIRRQRRPAR